MKLKKLCAALLSGILAMSLFWGTASSDAVKNSDTNFVMQTLENLSFEAEPFTASAASTMRRPCSSEAPMWIVHIETWNTADPQRIIQLIPEDIRPYVVFNISMSI
ncbi:MAG: glycoside hydrolase family 98 domain-containing protein, partial [Ruminococcus sp.]